MAFQYSDLETAAVEYLQPLLPEADVIVLPENESQYKRTFEKPRITVAYGGSDFMPTRSTGEVSQEEIVNMLFNIRSVNLRGARGIYETIGSLKKFLLGKRFTNVERLNLKDVQFEQREENVNFWSYTVTFTCKKLQVQSIKDDEGVIYPNLNQVTFRDTPIQTGQ